MVYIVRLHWTAVERYVDRSLGITSKEIKERFNLYISKAEESTFSEDTDRLLKEYEIIDDAQNKIKNNDAITIEIICILFINSVI